MDLAAIVNRNAGRLKSKVDSAGFIDELSRFGRVYVSAAPEDLADIVEDIHSKDISCIAIMGGDGTIHLTLTELYKRYELPPPLIFLGGGTINNIKRHFYGKRLPREILEEDAEEGITRLHWPLRISAGNLTHYGFIFGMGGVTRFLDRYYSQKGFDSRYKALPAVRLVAKLITSAIFHGKTAGEIFDKDRYTLLVKDKEIEVSEEWEGREYTVLLAGTIPGIGLGFSPLSKAGGGSGFHMMASYAGAAVILKNIMSIRNGRYYENVSHRVTRHLTIKEGPEKYTLDGDVYTADYPITIELAERIRIIVPEHNKR